MFAYPTNISGFSGYRATIDCLGAAQGNGSEYTVVFLDLDVLGYQFMGSSSTHIFLMSSSKQLTVKPTTTV
jgi:hypothetical protein